MSKPKFTRYLHSKKLDISEVVEDSVYMDSYDRGGELEILKAELAYLTKIVGFMAKKMSAGDQRDLAKYLYYIDAEE